ncbi:MAG: hypothetical protein G01um101429_668 [Parcubacteria group bacterium Gr01-1014_29]|nr:MAG: hypothetical protein G01um101429_668 [Parcubacteria group bacterium Gr01-1014_29]
MRFFKFVCAAADFFFQTGIKCVKRDDFFAPADGYRNNNNERYEPNEEYGKYNAYGFETAEHIKRGDNAQTVHSDEPASYR